LHEFDVSSFRAQSIVISLKESFYEKADALIGICKVLGTFPWHKRTARIRIRIVRLYVACCLPWIASCILHVVWHGTGGMQDMDSWCTNVYTCDLELFDE
jgi:hypothetical protein